MVRAFEEPRAKQATLAALAPHKYKLVSLLKSGEYYDEKETVMQLMRLINVDDEPILHEMVTKYLFEPRKRLAGVSLPGQTALILMTFYLGYCKSDE